MAGDIEKAKREIRYAKSTADDKRWDQLEPKLQAIEAALVGVPDAEKAPVAAEVAAMREKMLKGLREEKAGRIEREIKRDLSAAADDLKSGYDESPRVPKVIARLESAEAKDVLSPETVAAFQAEIATLQGKSKKGAPPPPPKPAATSAADSADLEKAKRELRAAKMTADDKRWDQLEAKLQAVEAALKSAPDAGIAAEVAALREKMNQALRADKAAAFERELKRDLGAAADDLKSGYDESPKLPKIIARLAEAKDVLTPQAVAAFQAEIDALQAKSKKGAPPPPPKPAAAATSSADAEKAKRELRAAKMTADDKRWDQLEPKLQAVEAALRSAPDAAIAAEVAALREKMNQALRADKAAAFERELKRDLGAAADDLKSGYDESPKLPKIIARLAEAKTS
ncbi:MAG TPA: hypothetical protein VF950_14690 [Planctomycetota bacterium]